MDSGYQGLDEPWNSRGAWSWGIVGSVVVHALIVVAVILAFHERPSKPRVVVPVEAIALVPFKPGPAGGGGGRPGPVTRPEPAAPKPAPVPPRPNLRLSRNRGPRSSRRRRRRNPPGAGYPDPGAAPAIGRGSTNRNRGCNQCAGRPGCLRLRARGARGEDGEPGPAVVLAKARGRAQGPVRRSKAISKRFAGCWKSRKIIPSWPAAAIFRE